MAQTLTFLDLEGCSIEEKAKLLAIIKPAPNSKTSETPSRNDAKTSSDAMGRPTALSNPVATPNSMAPPINNFIGPMPPPLQHPMQYQGAGAVQSSRANHQPYVYINNVTANVNVHHGPPSANAPNTGDMNQQQAQQLPQQHVQPQQQKAPIQSPHPLYGGALPHLFPGPHTPYVHHGLQPPQHAAGYMAAGPLPTHHQLMAAGVKPPTSLPLQSFFYLQPYSIPPAVSSQASAAALATAELMKQLQPGQPNLLLQQQQRQHPPKDYAFPPPVPPPPSQYHHQQQQQLHAVSQVAQQQGADPPMPTQQAGPVFTPNNKPGGVDEDKQQQVKPEMASESVIEEDKNEPVVREEMEETVSENLTNAPEQPVDDAVQEGQDDAAEKKEQESEVVEEPKTEDGETTPVVIPEPVPEGPSSKSWASLFHKDTGVTGASANQKPMARITPYSAVSATSALATSSTSAKTRESRPAAATNNDVELAKFLSAYNLAHKSPSIRPRGLSNHTNWCFVNAILQALAACPPFFNLLKALPADKMEPPTPSTKILRAMRNFVAEFDPLDNFPKLNRRDKAKKNEEVPLGKTFEATSVTQVLLNLDSDMFKGRQEDAEEFLTFVLNELNDEMMALQKLLVDESENHSDGDEVAGDDGDEWREVHIRNRSLVTRRVGGCGEAMRTPLGAIFRGQMKSCVQIANSDPTATLQPFFTLQLDIQSDSVTSVSDALARNFAESEKITGYICSKTKNEVDASRSLFLDELPAVLVLHLKRFVYDGTSAGCQKLLKNIDFPVDLEIPNKVLSPNSRNKSQSRQRSYKLFAVVYHNGKEASGGHYVADVFHAGLGWLKCDDSTVKWTNINNMGSFGRHGQSTNSVPYILFYRRGDTTMSSTTSK